MSKHTPGPWLVEPSYHSGPLGGEGFAIGAVFQWPEGENAFVGLAFTPAIGVGPYGSDHEANACLIAAAPDLLAALKAMMDGAYGNPAFPDENALVEEEAAKAIAKAEGK